MQTEPVRPEDVQVIDCVDLLVHEMGELAYDTGRLTFEEESWAVCLWCLFNDAVYYAAPAGQVDLDAAGTRWRLR
jgi:hypothetical protein